MNLPNAVYVGKGGIQFYRCGKTDHIIRDCPLRFTATLAFAPRKGKGVVKGKSKGTFIADDALYLGNESQQNATGEVEPNTVIVDGGPSNGLGATPSIDQGNDPQSTEPYGNQWLSGWFQEELPHDAYTARSFEGEEWLYFDMQQESSASADSSLCAPMPLIDCGASRTVVGIPWLIKWFGVKRASDLPAFLPSARVFRFGSQTQFSPLGRLIVSGTVSVTTMNHERCAEILSIEADVISLNIPFLVSHVTLCLMRAKLDFAPPTLTIASKFVVELIPSSSGHLKFDWRPITNCPVVKTQNLML